MKEKIRIGEIKISQAYYIVEYKSLEKPFSGQVNVPINEWSDENLLKMIKQDLEAKAEAIAALDAIVARWNNKVLDVE